MAALPAERLDSMSVAGSSLGWQDMRQQLFGQQRQREVESRLTRVLTEIHQRVARATRGGLASPKQRGKALAAIIEGANQLICWHRDELLAGRTAGVWAEPLPDTAGDLLREVRASFSMFEGASVAGREVDCADVVQAIAYLRGDESDAFFNEALAGSTALLAGVFDRVLAEEPTAGAAAALSDAWDALLTDVEALALPVHEGPAGDAVVIPLPVQRADLELNAAVSEADQDEIDEREPALSIPDPAEAEPVAAADVPDPEPAPLRLATAAGVLRRLEVVMLPEMLALPAMPDMTPILAARFGRIQLVAC